MRARLIGRVCRCCAPLLRSTVAIQRGYDPSAATIESFAGDNDTAPLAAVREARLC